VICSEPSLSGNVPPKAAALSVMALSSGSVTEGDQEKPSITGVIVILTVMLVTASLPSFSCVTARTERPGAKAAT
jgi:hypothetical protein